MSPPVIVNISEHGGPRWNWVGGRFPADQLLWKSYSAQPRGFERRITRPQVSRYRACIQGVAAAKKHDAAVLVTHEPLITSCAGGLYQSTRLQMPHLALAFTFSTLPTGVRRAAIAKAVRKVDRFVCFSSIERNRYAEYFGIPVERIDVLRWSAAMPPFDATAAPIEKGDYLCAIGGEGRDMATLLEAMEQLPDLRLAMVTRPANVEGLRIPSNVELRMNIPFDDVWNITFNARLHVLPLLTTTVPCGHGTLIMAMQLETPSVVTESLAMTDYVEPETTAITCPPGDPTALARAIRRLWDDAALRMRLTEAGRAFALHECSEDRTVEYFRDYLQYHGLLTPQSAGEG